VIQPEAFWKDSLSGIDVACVVKLADRAGLDAAKYAGRSLRAGHATSAATAGVSERLGRSFCGAHWFFLTDSPYNTLLRKWRNEQKD
jgi:hypothetical protein